MMNCRHRARDVAIRWLSIQQTSPKVELLAVGLVCCLLSSNGRCGSLGNYEWDLVNPQASWAARAGLQVVELNDQFYLMGGRTPRPPSDPPIPGDSDIWADVWSSDDRGESWSRILATDSDRHWSARAYFQAVTKDERIYVLGGPGL